MKEMVLLKQLQRHNEMAQKRANEIENIYNQALEAVTSIKAAQKPAETIEAIPEPKETVETPEPAESEYQDIGDEARAEIERKAIEAAKAPPKQTKHKPARRRKVKKQ